MGLSDASAHDFIRVPTVGQLKCVCNCTVFRKFAALP